MHIKGLHLDRRPIESTIPPKTMLVVARGWVGVESDGGMVAETAWDRIGQRQDDEVGHGPERVAMVQCGSIRIGVDGGMTVERARSRIGQWRDDKVEHGSRPKLAWWLSE